MNEIPHPGFDTQEEYETFTTTNGLEEAVEKQINEALFKWSYDDEDGIEQYVHDAFIAGAKWQADHTPLPEDTVIWNDGFKTGREIGARDMKEQMMKEAVEGYVTFNCDAQEEGLPCATVIANEKPLEFYESRGFKLGDKVRVIVLPKED